MTTFLFDAALIAGPVPTAVSTLGALAGIYLLVRRSRRWWARQVPAAVACGVAPTLGNLAGTVGAAFGGDMGAYRGVDPGTELRTTRYPDTAGVLVVGRNDDVYRPQAEHLAAAARAAGLGVGLREVPGEHSWGIASDALATALPWIAGRTGLIDPVPAPSADAAIPDRAPIK